MSSVLSYQCKPRSDATLHLCLHHQVKTSQKSKKKLDRQSCESRECTITSYSPSQTPRGRENRQNQTTANRTNVRKALILTLSFPSEVNAMLKRLKNTSTKYTKQNLNKPPLRIDHKAPKSKSNTGTTALERVGVGVGKEVLQHFHGQPSSP